MNTITIELKIRPETKSLFLNWNKENHGPHFIVEEKSAGYFNDKKRFAGYHSQDWDEVILKTVIPICSETLFYNLLDKAVGDLNIDLKYLAFYQDPGTGEASGGWFKYERKEG